MSIRIIDNKKIDLTEDEFQFYQELCRSYDRPNAKGSDLFMGLFETDDKGIIVFIKPPSVRYTSMEVFCFVCALYQHQHIRLIQTHCEKVCADLTQKVNEAIADMKGKS